MARYTVGMDFGTLSVRSVLLDADSGKEMGCVEFAYPHGVMETSLPDGTPLPKDYALQHPEDYLLGLSTVKELLSQCNVDPCLVGALAVDFTTCTVVSVDQEFTPLCMKSVFSSQPHAYVKLWKHHGAQKQSEKITDLAHQRKEAWIARYGGKVSCEWLLPKILETLEEAPEVYENTFRFLDAGDWISYVLTEEESHACAFAGFKALFDGEAYPSKEFMKALNPRLENLCQTKVSQKIVGAGKSVGGLSENGALLTGLPVGTPVSAPLIDAQASMPGLNAVGEGEMMMVVGTSCCHIVNSKRFVEIPGIAGVVKDAVVDGYYTYEAGQSGAGDCFDWFVKNCVNESYIQEARKQNLGIHAYLRSLAQKLSPGESGVLCLDWLNGNRSVLCDHSLSGMFLGLTLGTRPEELYRALLEATVFGTRIILERYEEYGIALSSVCATGGIANKDPLLMQIFADVLNRPVRVPKASHSGAKGSAVVAAVTAGYYPDLLTACRTLCQGEETVYRPICENVAVYQKLYEKYCYLHDLFGKENRLMKELRELSFKVRSKKH